MQRYVFEYFQRFIFQDRWQIRDFWSFQTGEVRIILKMKWEYTPLPGSFIRWAQDSVNFLRTCLVLDPDLHLLFKELRQITNLLQAPLSQVRGIPVSFQPKEFLISLVKFSFRSPRNLSTFIHMATFGSAYLVTHKKLTQLLCFFCILYWLLKHRIYPQTPEFDDKVF